MDRGDKDSFDIAFHLRKIDSRTARIDERTEHMERRLDDLQTQNESQDEKIDSLDERVNRHGMILGLITFGSATVFATFVDKLNRIFHLL